jgi:hypothetical protein
LVVSSLPSGPIQVALGTTVSVSTAIQNVGTGSSSDAFDISVYLSVDESFDSADVLVGRVTLPDVVLPMETRSINILASVDFDFPEGSYRWVAVVNAEGGQAESDGTNNSAIGTPVSVVLIQPDLSLASPPNGVSAVYKGVTTDVQVEVKNSDDGATAQAFDVVVYLSADPFVGDDIRVGDVAITTGIAVNEVRTVTVPARVSAVQSAGVYHWIVVVDDSGFVVEGDEGNNSSVGAQVSVLSQPADLVVATEPSGPGLVIRNSFHEGCA